MAVIKSEWGTNTIPQWIVRGIAGAALMGSLAWGAWNTKLDVAQESRIAVVESEIPNTVKQLDRIEAKVDKLLDERRGTEAK